MACGDVSALKLPDVKITESAAVTQPATISAVRRARIAASTVSSAREIRFSLLTARALEPQVHDGRQAAVYVGSRRQPVRASVNSGFATVGTDTGHQGRRSPTPAGRSTTSSARLNFGLSGRSPHRRKSSKAIVRSYYRIGRVALVASPAARTAAVRR